jgi:hypothetical protein
LTAATGATSLHVGNKNPQRSEPSGVELLSLILYPKIEELLRVDRELLAQKNTLASFVLHEFQ